MHRLPILAAIGTWTYLFYQSGYAHNQSYALRLTLGDTTYEMMPVMGMFICSLVALVVVSLVTAPPSEKTLERFFPATGEL